MIYNSLIKAKGELDFYNIQNILYLNVSSYLILNHSSKVREFLEIHNSIRILINQSFYLDFTTFSIKTFEKAFTFAKSEEY